MVHKDGFGPWVMIIFMQQRDIRTKQVGKVFTLHLFSIAASLHGRTMVKIYGLDMIGERHEQLSLAESIWEVINVNYFLHYKQMGIIAHETMTTETGIEVSDYYINVGEIKISKQAESLTKYNVWTDYNCYANKAARTAMKDPFKKLSIHLET